MAIIWTELCSRLPDWFVIFSDGHNRNQIIQICLWRSVVETIFSCRFDTTSSFLRKGSMCYGIKSGKNFLWRPPSNEWPSLSSSNYHLSPLCRCLILRLFSILLTKTNLEDWLDCNVTSSCMAMPKMGLHSKRFFIFFSAMQKWVIYFDIWYVKRIIVCTSWFF